MYRAFSGAFQTAFSRPVSPAVTDSSAASIALNFCRFGSTQSSVAADFLLFVLAKVMGELSRVIYPVTGALPAAIGTPMACNALRYREGR
jgi:hypothetical protein